MSTQVADVWAAMVRNMGKDMKPAMQSRLQYIFYCGAEAVCNQMMAIAALSSAEATDAALAELYDGIQAGIAQSVLDITAGLEVKHGKK